MTEKKRIISLAIIFMVLGAFGNILYCQEAGQSSASLKGISEMGLLVENVSPSLDSAGVDESSIRDIIQAKLDEIGIKTITMKETRSIKGAPYLYLNVGTIKSINENIYAVSITLEFRQNVFLSRNIKIESFGIPTWSTTSIGIFSKNKLSAIYNYVKKDIDKFIYAYSYANSH